MEPKLFLKKLRERYPRATSKLSYFGLTWNQWAKFTKITSTLDYGCNFNANGKTCSKNRHYGEREEMCCCAYCLSHVGYLSLIPNNNQVIKEIASLFDEQHGFWREKKGCILPVQHRSDTCIAYRCDEARSYRNAHSLHFYGSEAREQMILYFLDTLRSDKFSKTQIRTIIKELIK